MSRKNYFENFNIEFRELILYICLEKIFWRKHGYTNYSRKTKTAG